jgi:hypothetical protein
MAEIRIPSAHVATQDLCGLSLEGGCHHKMAPAEGGVRGV